MKKVIVIGAGISGLVCANYLRRAGFDVTVFEKHIIPGGMSAQWKRKDYIFEGGMHWLGGAIEKMPINEIWKNCGALKENNPLYFRDPFYTLYRKDKQIMMWRNLEKMKEEFLKNAPEDAKMIKKLCRDVKFLSGVHSPLADISGLKTKIKHKMGMIEALKMAPAVLKLLTLAKIPLSAYIEKFKNEDIKHLLYSVIGYRYNAYSMVYTISSFAQGDCGYPRGGSLVMANNMAETFLNRGGKIEYRKEVKEILIDENGRAKGVRIFDGVSKEGQTLESDAVVCTVDLMASEKLIAEDKIPQAQKKIFENASKCVPEMTMFVCYGVNTDLSSYPKGMVIPLPKEKPFEAAGIKFSELRINNYATYRDITCEGKTSLTCLLLGDSYDYWKKAKEDGTYKEKKEDLKDRLLKIIEENIPEVSGNIEITDVATPLTYERYTNAYQGSWMSVWNEKNGLNNFKEKSKIPGLYFAGERLNMTGGLPIAAITGWHAAQYVTKDAGYIFESNAQ